MNRSTIKKATVYIFFILSLLLLADCLMYYYYFMSFVGYFSDLLLFWLWFCTSILVIVFFWQRIISKLFLSTIILILIGSILPMMIPFYAFILSMTSIGLKVDKNLNEKYRAQVVCYSVMTLPCLELIEKKGIVEQKLFTLTETDINNYRDKKREVKYEAQLHPNLEISEVKDIFVEAETNKTITLTLFYGQPNQTLTFDKLTKKLIKIKTE